MAFIGRPTQSYTPGRMKHAETASDTGGAYKYMDLTFVHVFADGHTVSNAPDLFRPPKLSSTGIGQY